MTSAAYLVFAIPVGRLADRIGRFPVFVAGHALLLAMYAGLIGLDGGRTLVCATLFLLGLYYAATEGMLMALGSALLPEALRTSGLAILMTALALARICGSAVFGFGWSRFGLQMTVAGYMSASRRPSASLSSADPRERSHDAGARLSSHPAGSCRASSSRWSTHAIQTGGRP